MPPSRSKRMEVVLSLARREEDAAATRLGEVQRLLAEEQAQLQQLEDYLREYRENFNSRTRGLRGEELATFTGFTQRLIQAREQQRGRIGQVSEQVDKVRTIWHMKHHKRRSIADLVERLRTEENAALERRLQKEMDELIGRSYGKNH